MPPPPLSTQEYEAAILAGAQAVGELEAAPTRSFVPTSQGVGSWGVAHLGRPAPSPWQTQHTSKGWRHRALLSDHKATKEAAHAILNAREAREAVKGRQRRGECGAVIVWGRCVVGCAPRRMWLDP